MDSSNSSILSVGIDIGTTTTSMIVSRLTFLNTAVSYMVPRIDITNKEILYKSKLYLTPLKDDTHLDGEAIREIIDKEYSRAEITPSEVASGAVIITGESALKENADNILANLSSYAGEFVVATAGPELESVIAGRGSGAESYSKEHSCVVANLDIGGGTTNIAVFDCGELIGKTCLDIGGRLLKYDDDGVITYVSVRLNDLARKFNFSLESKQMTVRPDRLQYMTDIMAKVIEQALDCASGAADRTKYGDTGEKCVTDDRELARTMLTANSHMLENLPKIDCISFSGGVADCYYSDEDNYYKYNDLGVSLAKSLRAGALVRNCEVIKPVETIRATVVGAGVYTTVVSGSTISYSRQLFPIKNVPAFIVGKNAEDMAFRGDSRALSEELRWFEEQNGSELLICCFKGKKKVKYEELCNLAKCIAQACEPIIQPNRPLLVLTENDMAKSLGQTISRFQTRKQDVVCIDKIKAQQGDYIDLGNPLMKGLAVPVVVKTLIFK